MEPTSPELRTGRQRPLSAAGGVVSGGNGVSPGFLCSGGPAGCESKSLQVAAARVNPGRLRDIFVRLTSSSEQSSRGSRARYSNLALALRPVTPRLRDCRTRSVTTRPTKVAACILLLSPSSLFRVPAAYCICPIVLSDGSYGFTPVANFSELAGQMGL